MKWVLWAANVQSKTLDERLVAARAGGYRSMSVFPFDVAGWRDEGLDLADIRRRCGVAGVGIDVVDPFAQWLPDREPPEGLSDDDRAFTDFDEDEILDMAVGLGARAVNLVEPYGQPVETGLAVERFGHVCDRAAEEGLRVQLEAMPFSGIADLDAAWEIVRRADRPNGGLTLDVWHVLQAGDDPLARSRIPADRIFTVQLADAPAPVGDDLMTELYRRVLPGEGVLDVAGIVASLRTAGALDEVGIEVFGPGLTSLPPDEIGRRTRRALAALVSTAGGSA